MEQSILISTKKVLQIGPEDESFDLDILTHINSAFSTLHQVGIGPLAGFQIEDDGLGWDDFVDPGAIQNMVKTYVYLKVRFVFDPPTMPSLLTAVQSQLDEHIFRLSVMREETDWVDPDPIPVEIDDQVPIIDGGGADGGP